MNDRLAEQIASRGGALILGPEEPNSRLSPGSSSGADPHWRPVPAPDGGLIQDPDFSLPTKAGPLRWSLFYDSTAAATAGPWGYGRRASFPLYLDYDSVAGVVTVSHEDGTLRVYHNCPDITDVFFPAGDNY